MTTRTTEPFRYDLIPPGSAVLCALSGGADSMYLLHRLLEGAARGGYTVRAAHYHHGLRPDAGRDEDFVRAWCEGQGVPLAVERGDVAAQAARTHRGVEETARAMRYDFLGRTAQETGCARIATGHHAGDNAETVLLNLIRGCGLNGLGGIPLRREALIRPMLALTREEILDYLARHRIPHVEDESNQAPDYARNRVRHQILPLLEQLNPRAAAHLAAAARRAAADEAVLWELGETLARRAVTTPEGVALPVEAVNAAPAPVALRALKQLAPAARAVHLEGMLALCRPEGHGELALPGGRVVREYDTLFFPNPAPPSAPPARLARGRQLWNGWLVEAHEAICPEKAYLSPTEFYLRPGDYLLRPRREGDAIRLGHRPEKTIKKLMMEGRVPRHLRAGVPVLEGPGGVAAVGGFGPHRDALALPGAQALHIILRKGE